METLVIKTQLEKQLPMAETETINMFLELLKNVNQIATISSFKVGLNTSFNTNETDSNLTILKFESPIEIKRVYLIINEFEEHLDEYINQYQLFDTDTLVISLDY